MLRIFNLLGPPPILYQSVFTGGQIGKYSKSTLMKPKNCDFYWNIWKTDCTTCVVLGLLNFYCVIKAIEFLMASYYSCMLTFASLFGFWGHSTLWIIMFAAAVFTWLRILICQHISEKKKLDVTFFFTLFVLISENSFPLCLEIYRWNGTK